MSLPKAQFSYAPLSGKAPLIINFINESQNLGGLDEWSSCSLGKKYYHSIISSLNDVFALDFSQWSNEGIKQTYDSNGFRLESNGVYFPNFIENPVSSPIKTVQTTPEYPVSSIDDIKYILPTEQINVDLTKDFHIEMTIVEFNNYHGSIQLYFQNLSVDGGAYSYSPGIHINTGGGFGAVRAITNSGDSTYLTQYELPIKIIFEKMGDTLNLYVGDRKVHWIAAAVVGIGKKSNGSYDNARNLLCPLKLKMTTQNNVSNWCMHIKDIYIIGKQGDNSNIPNVCEGFAAQYLWDFDDGNTSIEENPEHQFENEGPHTVSLKVTNEYGENITTRIVNIYPDNNPLPNAGEIFREKNAEVVRDLDTIPDYCSNERLRNIINMMLYDSIRHADMLQDSITARLKLTIDETIDDSRNIRCETSFISDLYQSPPTGSPNSVNEHVVRTLVEADKQNDVIDVEFDLQDPE